MSDMQISVWLRWKTGFYRLTCPSARSFSIICSIKFLETASFSICLFLQHSSNKNNYRDIPDICQPERACVRYCSCPFSDSRIPSSARVEKYAICFFPFFIFSSVFFTLSPVPDDALFPSVEIVTAPCAYPPFQFCSI